MPTLEEVTYEAGRAALADQDAVVAGVRQRTGTLLAAHALVASFLGATSIRETGVELFSWLAIVALVAGLIVSATILAPWELRFALDAGEVYAGSYPQAAAEAEAGTLGWLASLGRTYQEIREANNGRVQVMSRLSALVGVLMVVQTLLWMCALGLQS